ncbi:MAG: beta-propeller domain-containing protein [Pseudomonadota bacterium]|nr:beta-propeller domain-containing protein [Pseudomonadota bacterium]
MAALDRFTSPTLTRFGSEAEFHRFVDAVREVERTRHHYRYSRANSGPVQFAQVSDPAVQSDEQSPLCDPELEECPGEDDTIVVTGSRVAPPSNPSITNNQMRGVEEGDIVKQIDRFLIVLQDGRLFVVDTAANGNRLALVDRMNVYRNPQSDMWYDEMLVFGDRILVTGYSYDEGATELAVFRLGTTGRVTREGVFRISSNDYYSTSNYATRLIDGNLVTYTPLRIDDLERADFRWPVVRRWLPADDARTADFLERRRSNWRLRPNDPPTTERPLVDAAQIFRPVRRVENDVVIHSVSICPLASADGGASLTCRSTAFVGPETSQWYATGHHVYLWTVDRGSEWRGRCQRNDPVEISRAEPALIYRVDVPSLQPALVAARGEPPDQFAMQADPRNFYALVRLIAAGCGERYDSPSQLAFLSLPMTRFDVRVSDVPISAFTDMPGTENHSVASRFTDRYLVYGGLSRFRRGYPDLSQYEDYGSSYRRRVLRDLQPRPAYVVPIGRPYAVEPLSIGHTVIRAERVADDIVLTGYRDRRGLSISLIDLDARPRIGSNVLLDGRYESEGRSHAFNSLVEEDGGGLMGLPTVGRVDDSDRHHWRSKASDVSFLTFERGGRIQPIGELERRFDYVDDYDEATREEDEDGVPGYQCEVSCIDWYGNSRPIFTDGRVFALAGTELIEGRVDAGRIREVQRLNIALAGDPH